MTGGGDVVTVAVASMPNDDELPRRICDLI
jgi:hypothetical protein